MIAIFVALVRKASKKERKVKSEERRLNPILFLLSSLFSLSQAIS
jgi:hypothetical protein